MWYAAYGRILESNRPLPELLPAEEGPGAIRVTWDAPVRVPPGARWSTLWRFDTGEPWVTVARSDAFRFFRFARFLDVSLSGDDIAIAPRGYGRPGTLRHLFLDQALPLALASRGHLVLHASAVEIAGTAVLLAGVAGAGKSTLAALVAGMGHPLLADDGALLSEVDGILHAAPSYPGLRLFDDSARLAGMGASDVPEVAEYTVKRRVTGGPARPAVPSLVPLGTIYVLSWSDGRAIRISPLSRRDAAFAIVQHAYRDDVSDERALRAQLDLIGRWAPRFRVCRLECPRILADAPAAAAALARHAAGGSDSPAI